MRLENDKLVKYCISLFLTVLAVLFLIVSVICIGLNVFSGVSLVCMVLSGVGLVYTVGIAVTDYFKG